MAAEGDVGDDGTAPPQLLDDVASEHLGDRIRLTFTFDRPLPRPSLRHGTVRVDNEPERTGNISTDETPRPPPLPTGAARVNDEPNRRGHTPADRRNDTVTVTVAQPFPRYLRVVFPEGYGAERATPVVTHRGPPPPLLPLPKSTPAAPVLPDGAPDIPVFAPETLAGDGTAVPAEVVPTPAPDPVRAPGLAAARTFVFELTPRWQGQLAPADAPPASWGGEPVRAVEPYPFRFNRISSAWGSDAAYIDLAFDASPSLDSAREDPPTIAVEPAVDFTITRYGRDELRLLGAFKPGTLYTVTLRKNLRSVGGAALGREIVRTAWIGDAPTSLALDGQRPIFRADGPLKMQLVTRNLTRVRLEPRRLQPQNLAELLLRGSYRYGHPVPEELAETLPAHTITVENESNEYVTTPVDLRAALGVKRGADEEKHVRPGVYGLTAASDDAGGRRSRRWWDDDSDRQFVTVTNLGLSVRYGPDQALAWVVGLADGRPVEGARVLLYSTRRRRLATATTDADGLARLAWTPPDAAVADVVTIRNHGDVDGGLERPALAVVHLGDVETGGDMNYILLEKDRAHREAGRSGRDYLRDGVEVFATAARGVYRPGDAVDVSALARGVGDAIAAGLPLVATLSGPDGRAVHSLPVTTDAAGRATARFDLPADRPSGLYRVAFALPAESAVRGSASFRMADYMPQTVRLRVDAADAMPANAAFALALRGEELFGGPARGLRGNVAVRLEPLKAPWPAWRGWSFGQAKDADAAPRPFRRAFQLDDDGRAAVNVPAFDAPGIWTARFDATLLDVGGRPVEETFTRTLFNAPAIVAVNAPSRELPPERDAVLPLARVGADGAAVGDGPWTATLYRLEYTNMLRRGENGLLSYQYTREPVAEKQSTGTWKDGRAEVTIHPAQYGQYELRVEDGAGAVAAVVPLWAYGSRNEIAWPIENPEALVFRTDREAYPVGADAKIIVGAPFAGLALFTLETDRVLATRLVDLAEGKNEVVFPVTDAWAPNAYLSATLVRPNRPEAAWTPRRARGFIRLSVDRADRRLAVAFDAPTLRPGEPVDVPVTVRRADGTPAAGAAVVVAAVDEGVLALTRFVWPSPWDFFYGPRRAPIAETDIYARLAPELAAWEAAPTPGGGEKESGLGRRLNPIDARRVRTAALYVGDAVAGDDGVATVRLDLPEYVGELRLMAWAASGADYGAGVESRAVRADVMLRASLPRFAAPGDAWTTPVRCYNRGAEDAALTLTVALTGPVDLDDPRATPLPLTKDGVRRYIWPDVPVPAGGERDHPVALRATGVGRATVRFEVSAGDERFGETVEFPVRPAAAFARAGGYQDIPAGDAVTVTPTADFIPGTAAATLWVGGGEHYARAAVALDALIDYPYGCHEQTAARLMGLAAAPDLVAALRPGMAGREEMQRFVDSGLRGLQDGLNYDGSLGLWPRAFHNHEWITLFAFDTALSLKAAGFDVPGDFTHRLAVRARTLLDGWLPKLQDGADDPRPGLYAAYATSLLAQTGAVPREALARLLARDDRRLRLGLPRPRAETALIADAAGFAGDPADAADRLAAPALHKDAVAGYFASLRRNDAIHLRAFARWRPDDPELPRLAQPTLDALGDRPWYLSTQEAAFGLSAFAAVVRVRPPVPDAPVTVRVDDREEIVSARAGRMFKLPAPDTPVTIQHAAADPVPVRWWVEGVPLDGAVTEADRNLSVRRHVLDADDQPLADPSRLVAGRVYTVKLSLAGGRGDAVALVELLPAGLELEGMVQPDPGTKRMHAITGDFWLEAVERRDDRVLAFGQLNGEGTFVYRARAVTAGAFTWPAADVAAMYDDARHGTHGRATVVVAAEGDE